MILSEQAKFVYGDLAKNEQLLIDSFVEVYGEGYREHITKIISECHIEFITDYDTYYEYAQDKTITQLCQNWGDRAQRKQIIATRDRCLKSACKNAINPQDFTKDEQREIVSSHELGRELFAYNLLEELKQKGVNLTPFQESKIKRLAQTCGYKFENVLAYLEKISPGVLEKIDFDKDVGGEPLKKALLESKRRTIQFLQANGSLDSDKEVSSKHFFAGGATFDCDKHYLIGENEEEFVETLHQHSRAMAMALPLPSKEEHLKFTNAIFMRGDRSKLSDATLIHELDHIISAFVRDYGEDGYAYGTGITFKSVENIQDGVDMFFDVGVSDDGTTALNEALTEFKARKVAKVFAEKKGQLFESQGTTESGYDYAVNMLTPIFEQMGQDAIDTSIAVSEFNIPLVYGFETFQELKDLAQYFINSTQYVLFNEVFENKHGVKLTPEWIETHPKEYEEEVESSYESGRLRKEMIEMGLWPKTSPKEKKQEDILPKGALEAIERLMKLKNQLEKGKSQTQTTTQPVAKNYDEDDEMGR